MRKLKVTISILVMLMVSTLSIGQMHIDSLYENKEEFLIFSFVQEFDSLTQDALNTKIKNWGAINFVNMKEVLVGETKEQLVFNYITTSFSIKSLGSSIPKSWYIRMVVLIKDNKIKVSLYDDGNSFWAGSYSGGVSQPSVQARTYKFADYFGKKGTCLKMYNDGLINVKKSCINITSSLIESIKSNTTTKGSSNDW